MGCRFFRVLIFGGAAALVVSCGGGGGWTDIYDIDEGGLVVRVTDASVDEALAVIVQFDAVDAKVSGVSSSFRLRPTQQIDMLTLAGGNSQQLVHVDPVLADRWQWVRLVISAGDQGTDSWVDTATGRHALYLPDENTDALLVRQSFVVPKNGTADLTIDFDLRKSIIPPENPGDPYILDPVLRMVETNRAGRIEGTVDPSVATSDGCTPVVYGFTGNGVLPDDIDRLAPEPLTEGAVALDIGSGEFRWSLDWLPAGDYTVALTCQGHLDRPDRDDTPGVGFQVVKTATVIAGEVTQLNL